MKKHWSQEQTGKFNSAYRTRGARKCRQVTRKGQEFVDLEKQYSEIVSKAVEPVPPRRDGNLPQTELVEKEQRSYAEFGRLFAEKIADREHRWLAELATYIEGKRRPRKSERRVLLKEFDEFKKQHKRIPSREELEAALNGKIQATPRTLRRNLAELGLKLLPRERTPVRGPDREQRVSVPRTSEPD